MRIGHKRAQMLMKTEMTNRPSLVVTTTKLKDVPLGTRAEVIHATQELLILRPLDRAIWFWAKRSEVTPNFQLTLADADLNLVDC